MDTHINLRNLIPVTEMTNVMRWRLEEDYAKLFAEAQLALQHRDALQEALASKIEQTPPTVRLEPGAVTWVNFDNDLQARIDELEQDLHSLNLSHKTKSHELMEALGNVSGRDVVNRNLRQAINRKNDLINRQAEEIQLLKKSIDTLNAEVGAQSTAAGKACTEIDILRNTIAARDEKVNELELINANLCQRNNRLVDDKERLIQERNSHALQIEGLKREIDEKDKLISHYAAKAAANDMAREEQNASESEPPVTTLVLYEGDFTPETVTLEDFRKAKLIFDTECVPEGVRYFHGDHFSNRPPRVARRPDYVTMGIEHDFKDVHKRLNEDPFIKTDEMIEKARKAWMEFMK